MSTHKQVDAELDALHPGSFGNAHSTPNRGVTCFWLQPIQYSQSLRNCIKKFCSWCYLPSREWGRERERGWALLHRSFPVHMQTNNFLLFQGTLISRVLFEHTEKLTRVQKDPLTRRKINFIFLLWYKGPALETTMQCSSELRHKALIWCSSDSGRSGVAGCRHGSQMDYPRPHQDRHLFAINWRN